MALERANLVKQGVANGRKAFIGPETVQFDVTNRCNNACLCCWHNSPLLGEPSAERRQQKQAELPFSLVAKTIRALKEYGTKKIFFAGGGEPFMHPRFMDILACAKECDMRVNINTNFSLVDTAMAKELVRLKIEHIHVSMLAGSAETYNVIHPTATDYTFVRLREVLKYLAREKRRVKSYIIPHINLYYVIFNKNYHDIPHMGQLGIDVCANSIEFTPIDVIPGKTDVLLLNDEQREHVIREVRLQSERYKKKDRMYDENFPVPFIAQKDSFIERLSHYEASDGRYEKELVMQQPCYVGWAFARILANGNVTPCLKAHNICAGNIYEQSFEEIWNSPAQQEFRVKTAVLDSGDPYLQKIGNDASSLCGCLDSCDNVQINRDMHRKYKKVRG